MANNLRYGQQRLPEVFWGVSGASDFWDRGLPGAWITVDYFGDDPPYWMFLGGGAGL